MHFPGESGIQGPWAPPDPPPGPASFWPWRERREAEFEKAFLCFSLSQPGAAS